MPNMKKRCEQIFGHLTSLDRPIVRLLKPGLSKAAIVKATSHLPFKIPKTAIELYQWRNGTQEGKATFAEMTLFPQIWHFLSLERAIAEYQGLMSDLPDFWDDHSFPLFCSSGCDYLGIRCKDIESDDGEIVAYREGSSGPNSEFVSLDAMVQTILRAFEEKAYFVDDQGNFELDDSRFAEIASQLNPGLDRWKM